MKKTFIKFLSLVMAALTILSSFPLVAMAASGPSLSTGAYCEFVAQKSIPAYRNAGLSVRGTAQPYTSYNASVYKNDVCRIYEITSQYIKLAYPTSSGYRTAYVRTSDVLPTGTAQQTTTAARKVYTYRYPGGTQYGYTEAGDKCFRYGTSGNYTAVIYQAKSSGSRAYKLGFVKTSDYNAYLSGKTSGKTSGGWQWPVSGKTTTQGFNSYSNAMAKKGRPYHSGVDLVSSNRNILAAANGTVQYKGYSSGNGYHVILKHTLSGKTVDSLYSHLSSYSNCPGVGGNVSKGQKIGVMGNTGNSTGTHLHFAIFAGSYNSDPWGYVSNSGSNKMTYKGMTFYSPSYVISNNRLP